MNSVLQTPAQSTITAGFRKRISSATVAVCTRDRPALLHKCLAAVSRLNPGPKQVLVIDNSEGNSDTRKVAHDYGARYVVEPVPGLCRARNRALAECETDIVVFIDDDIIPASNWLLQLLEPFSDEKTGATAGRVVTPEALVPDHHLRNRVLTNHDPHWFEIAAFGGLGLGANMAIRKRACAPESFFDERLGRGGPFEIGDESYAFASLLSKGYQIVYTPSAVVHHPPPTRSTIEREARNSFTYWLLLFSRFPRQRLTLIRFLIGSLCGKRLESHRDSQEPKKISSNSMVLKLTAALNGLRLFLSTPKPH